MRKFYEVIEGTEKRPAWTLECLAKLLNTYAITHPDARVVHVVLIPGYQAQALIERDAP